MSIISRMYGPKEVIIKGDYEFPDPVRVTECILGTSMESTISPHHREGRHQPEITEKKRNVLGLSAHSRILTPILRHESAKIVRFAETAKTYDIASGESGRTETKQLC